jgi:glutathione S-transferase
MHWSSTSSATSTTSSSSSFPGRHWAPRLQLELWHSWDCHHGMRVRAALSEKGIPFRSHAIGPGEKLDEFGGAAVVFMDRDEQMGASLMILEYLDARWAEPPLFPALPGGDAVKSAMARVDDAFAPLHPRIARGSPVERVQALGAARTSMETFEGEVPESGYLLGKFSAADLALASHVARLPPDWRPAQLGFRRLARWEREVMSRPAVREQMSSSAW